MNSASKQKDLNLFGIVNNPYDHIFTKKKKKKKFKMIMF